MPSMPGSGNQWVTNHERLMTVAEVATSLGISTKTLLEMVRDGKIKHIKLGQGYKFREQWVVDYVEEHASWQD